MTHSFSDTTIPLIDLAISRQDFLTSHNNELILSRGKEKDPQNLEQHFQSSTSSTSSLEPHFRFVTSSVTLSHILPHAATSSSGAEARQGALTVSQLLETGESSQPLSRMPAAPSLSLNPTSLVTPQILPRR